MGNNTYRRRGFLLKHRVTKLFRRIFRNSHRVKSFSRFINWSNSIKTKAKAIVSKNRNSGKEYIRVGQEPVVEKAVSVPKGHMAVYVGKKEGDFERILVPVVYINHPLFGDLLKETEKEFGYDHPGGITIPCRISEFERVQTRIKAVQCPRKLLTWKRSNKSLMVKS